MPWSGWPRSRSPCASSRPTGISASSPQRCLDSTELWYNVNAVGGQLILVAVGLSAIILMMYQGTWLKGFFSQLFLFVIPLVAAIGATLYFERKGGSWK
jgi:hypothetical protein